VAGAIRAAVLDVTMPRLSGTEALRELRLIRTDLPAVMMRGFTEADMPDRRGGEGPPVPVGAVPGLAAARLAAPGGVSLRLKRAASAGHRRRAASGGPGTSAEVAGVPASPAITAGEWQAANGLAGKDLTGQAATLPPVPDNRAPALPHRSTPPLLPRDDPNLATRREGFRPPPGATSPWSPHEIEDVKRTVRLSCRGRLQGR
jgi:hypothetical protein